MCATVKKASYPSQIYQRRCGFSFWQSASPLHQALCQPGTGPAAGETDLNDDKGHEHATRSDSGISVSQQIRGLEFGKQTLTAVVVAVFVLTMAKWDCASTSTSWWQRKKLKNHFIHKVTRQFIVIPVKKRDSLWGNPEILHFFNSYDSWKLNKSIVTIT